MCKTKEQLHGKIEKGMRGNLRLVKFNKWIPRVDEKTSFGSKAKDGTNCWETEFINEGIFHQWANAYEESSAGFGNYTVALVEIQDGTIVEVIPSKLKFI
jgi:hypothetical protein